MKNPLRKQRLKSGIPYDDNPRGGEIVVNQFIHRLPNLERCLDLLAKTHGDAIAILEDNEDIDLGEYRDRSVFRHDFVCPTIRLMNGLEIAHAFDSSNYGASKKYPLAINCPGYYNGVREFLRLSKEEQDPELAKLRQLDPVKYMLNVLALGDKRPGSRNYALVLGFCPHKRVRSALGRVTRK